MSRRKPALRHRRRPVPAAARYARAIQKVWYAQRPTPEERRALKRRRLEDGSYPLPGAGA